MNLGQQVDHHRAVAPAQHRHDVGVGRKFAQVVQGTGRNAAVVALNDFKLAPEHAPGGIDFTHGDLGAVAYGLGRGAERDAKFSVDGNFDGGGCQRNTVCAQQTGQQYENSAVTEVSHEKCLWFGAPAGGVQAPY